MKLTNAHFPQFTIVEEIDDTSVEELRASMNATRGDKVRLTLLPFLSSALCRAINDHPAMNAQYDDAADVILRHRNVYLGIATMTGAGLVVVVVLHAKGSGPLRTAAEIARLERKRFHPPQDDELLGQL